jgi:CubicO group peptidase (beta-lactamase class C family)
LQDVVQTAMRRFHVPGVAVGVVRDGVEETAGFGVTSIDNPLPVDADTLFQIGSITKTFTASAIMRLVEQGRIDLDAPVRGYVPGLRLADPSVTERVTLRHLLTHTAGFIAWRSTPGGTNSGFRRLT